MPEIIPNLHPFAVHFPIALVSLSAFFHVAALVMRNKPPISTPAHEDSMPRSAEVYEHAHADHEHQ